MRIRRRLTGGVLAGGLSLACGGESVPSAGADAGLAANERDHMAGGGSGSGGATADARGPLDASNDPVAPWDGGPVTCYVGEDNRCHLAGAPELPSEMCGGPITNLDYAACYEDPAQPGVVVASCCPSIGGLHYFDPVRGCRTPLVDGTVNFGCLFNSLAGGGCGYATASGCFARTTPDGGFDISISTVWIDSVMTDAGFTPCGYIDVQLEQQFRSAPTCP